MNQRFFALVALGATLIVACVASSTTNVMAQAKKPEAKTAAKPAADAAPTQLGTFGNWSVYASDTANGRVCYAPANLNRDPAYLFVSTRPKENVRDEVSFVLGFAPKDGADGQISIGKANYSVSPKAQAQSFVAWLKDNKDNATVVELMKKQPQLSLKLTSKRGNALTDTYALAGFAQALDQVKKACP
jgi:invasion protein IalB